MSAVALVLDDPSRAREEEEGESELPVVGEGSWPLCDGRDDGGCRCELRALPPCPESGCISIGAVGVVGVATPLMLISAGWRCAAAVPS